MYVIERKGATMRAKRMRNITLVAVFAVLCPIIWAATNHFACGSSGFSDYIINGAPDPTLSLVRGFTYTFTINAINHPFYIKSSISDTSFGAAGEYTDGVTGNGTPVGDVVFSVPNDAPDMLFYQCGNHPASMRGTLLIVDAPSVSITSFSVGLNTAEIESTGYDSDLLNLNVQTKTDLKSNTWENASIQSNTYANGTNTTTVGLTTNDSAFFQVQQGFF